MMTEQKAIETLNSLTDADPEGAHEIADAVLVQWLKKNGHADIANAWMAARERCRFWYA